MVGLVLAVLLQANTQADELVEKLRSDSVEERTRAARALEALGAAALPALEKAARDPDAEVAARARVILQSLPSGAPVDKVALPGGKVAFEVVGLSGGPGVRYALDAERKRSAPKGFELQPFGIGRREVTWEEFLAYYNKEKKRPDVDGVTRPSQFVDMVELPGVDVTPSGKFPVSCIRWHSAIGYCDWLSRVTGQYYRPPTEAEWDHACRAGQGGAAPAEIPLWGWFKESGLLGAAEVGKKRPNRHGIHDMLGNVWEYCLEGFRFPEAGPVVRGGGWTTSGGDVSFGAREPIRPEWAERDPSIPMSLWHLTDASFVGFRVVRVPDAAAAAEREEYAKSIVVKIHAVTDLKDQRRARGNHFVRVAGAVENGGERTIEELELAVYALDDKGKSHWIDTESNNGSYGRPTFDKCWPVLPNSAWAGEQSLPVPPKGVRKFVVDIPFSYDEGPDFAPSCFGARVTQLRLRP